MAADIQRVIAIDLPYPRERTSDALARLRRELFTEFRLVHQEAANGGGGVEGLSGAGI
ncbi:hypothetical protein [uncultured Thiodictyon sp.]|uniref:hypothetical protein n=1 Tax=uncultured Thiodictyon sp. TaxID=1846217 RepID=UPI0025D8D12F|nr:hypothetical protein [uncultured Thiodictyon sp.]